MPDLTIQFETANIQDCYESLINNIEHNKISLYAYGTHFRYQVTVAEQQQFLQLNHEHLSMIHKTPKFPDSHDNFNLLLNCPQGLLYSYLEISNAPPDCKVMVFSQVRDWKKAPSTEELKTHVFAYNETYCRIYQGNQTNIPLIQGEGFLVENPSYQIQQLNILSWNENDQYQSEVINFPKLDQQLNDVFTQQRKILNRGYKTFKRTKQLETIYEQYPVCQQLSMKLFSEVFSNIGRFKKPCATSLLHYSDKRQKEILQITKLWIKERPVPTNLLEKYKRAYLNGLPFIQSMHIPDTSIPPFYQEPMLSLENSATPYPPTHHQFSQACPQEEDIMPDSFFIDSSARVKDYLQQNYFDDETIQFYPINELDLMSMEYQRPPPAVLTQTVHADHTYASAYTTPFPPPASVKPLSPPLSPLPFNEELDFNCSDGVNLETLSSVFDDERTV